MSIHFYNALKAWHTARHDRKVAPAAPVAAKAQPAAGPEAANAAVYAAGIACAGQVAERGR